MLMIDGVKYELWTPPSEDDFERVVEKHAEEIFGKDAKYFDLKHRLASRSGIGSIPDGYVITLGDKPGVRIVELELASHSLQHIVSQMVNIINGIENPITQQKICNAIEDGINEDEIFAAKIAKAIKPVAIHRFLSDSFSNTLPIINIIIDKSSPVLEEAISKITPPPRIIEFQTFVREGVGLPVHAHLFEPAYQVPPKSKPPIEIPEPPSRNQLYQQFFGELIEKYCRRYPSRPMLKALPQSWLGFGAGKAGFWFNWSFRANRRFSVELIIHTEDSVKNKQYFDRIKGREAQLGIADVSWERLDDKKTSRVAVYTNGDIQEVMSDKLAKERLIEWAIETMKNFSDKFGTIIRGL